MNAFEWLLLVFFYAMLEKHLWNSSSLHLLVEIMQPVHEISSFSVVLYKRGVQKNLRSSHREVLCQKMFLEILPNSQQNIFAGISFLIKLQVAEASTGGSLWEKVFLEISQNSQENTCARVSILIKLQASVLELY